MNPFAPLIHQVSAGPYAPKRRARSVDDKTLAAGIIELRKRGTPQHEIASRMNCATMRVKRVLEQAGMNGFKYQQQQKLLASLGDPVAWRYRMLPGDKWTLTDSQPRGLPPGAKVQRLYAPDDAA